MKMSELETKSFLGAPGAAQNSYVLINYDDNATDETVSYKATLDELGKSIACNLGLYIRSEPNPSDSSPSAITVSEVNGEYQPDEVYYLMTSEYCDLMQGLTYFDYSGVADDVDRIKNDMSTITDAISELETAVAGLSNLEILDADAVAAITESVIESMPIPFASTDGLYVTTDGYTHPIPYTLTVIPSSAQSATYYDPTTSTNVTYSVIPSSAYKVYALYDSDNDNIDLVYENHYGDTVTLASYAANS